MVTHPVSHGEVIEHIPFAVSFNNLLFVSAVGVDYRGVFRIVGIGIGSIAGSAILSPLFTVFIDHHAFPNGLFGAAEPKQIDDQHHQGDSHADDDRFPQWKILHEESSDRKPDQWYKHQDQHTSDGAFAIGFGGGQYLRVIAAVGKSDQTG